MGFRERGSAVRFSSRLSADTARGNPGADGLVFGESWVLRNCSLFIPKEDLLMAGLLQGASAAAPFLHVGAPSAGISLMLSHLGP